MKKKTFFELHLIFRNQKNSYIFHYLVEGGITFVCMTDQKVSTRIPFAFLYDLATRFKSKYGDKAKFAQEVCALNSRMNVSKFNFHFFFFLLDVFSIFLCKGNPRKVELLFSKYIITLA